MFIYVFFKKKIVSKKCFSYVDELLFRLSLLNKGIVLVLISCATVNCFLIIVMGALSVSLSILHNYQLLQVLFTKTKKPSNLQRLHCVQVSPRAHRWLEMGKVLQEMKIEKKDEKDEKDELSKRVVIVFPNSLSFRGVFPPNSMPLYPQMGSLLIEVFTFDESFSCLILPFGPSSVLSVCS